MLVLAVEGGRSEGLEERQVGLDKDLPDILLEDTVADKQGSDIHIEEDS